MKKYEMSCIHIHVLTEHVCVCVCSRVWGDTKMGCCRDSLRGEGDCLRIVGRGDSVGSYTKTDNQQYIMYCMLRLLTQC